MNQLFTGHEADVAAIEAANHHGELVTLKIKVRHYVAVLAHPFLPLGRQDDGSVVLSVEVFRRAGQSSQDVTAEVLLTTFRPRPGTWVEEGRPPEWRVDAWDTIGWPRKFGAGAICEFWDGVR